MNRTLILSALALLAAGCAPARTPGTQTLDVSGLWHGKLTANDRELSADLVLMQKGSTVNGRFYFPEIKETFSVHGTLNSGRLFDDANKPSVDLDDFFTATTYRGKFTLLSIFGTFTFGRAARSAVGAAPPGALVRPSSRPGARLAGMTRALLFALALAPSAVARTATPAPLNGIWKLTGLSQQAGDNPKLPPVSAQLFISGDRVWGKSICLDFEGRVRADGGRVQLTAARVPGRLHCMISVRGDFLGALNAADRYVVNRDHLILFSRGAHLTFERVGFVTPAKGR